MYSMTVAQAMVSYRNFAYEALEAFKEHEIEIEKQKLILQVFLPGR